MRKPSERNPRIRFPLNSVRAEVPCTLSVVVNLTTIEPAAQENQNNYSAPKGSLTKKGQRFKEKIRETASPESWLFWHEPRRLIEGINSTNKVLAQFHLMLEFALSAGLMYHCVEHGCIKSKERSGNERFEKNQSGRKRNRDA